MRIAAMLGAAMMVAQVANAELPDSAPGPDCHLVSGAALGCYGDPPIGPENASAMFELYGRSASSIHADETKAYASRYECVRVFDPANKMAIRANLGRDYPVADPHQTIMVRFVSVAGAKGDLDLWIDDRYLTGPCRRFSKEDLAREEARSVNINSPSHD